MKPLSASAFLLLLSLAGTAPLLTACSSDNDPAPAATPDGQPVGAVTTLQTGTLKPQSGTPTAGTLAVVRDAQGAEFVQLNPDFVSDFHTGNVNVYLAKSSATVRQQRTADPASVRSLGIVNQNGRHTLRVPDGAAGFTHVIIYCQTAEINFGYAQLQ